MDLVMDGYYQAPAVAFNPLQTATQLQNLKNSQLSNRIAQQGYDATQAQQQAYQGATDENGNVDQNKLIGSMGRGAGAQNTGAVQSNVAGLNTSKQALTQAQFDLYQKHADAVNKISTTIASNPDASVADVYSLVGQAVKNGNISPQAASQGLVDLPPANAPAGALQQWAARHAAQSAGFKEQLDNMSAQYINTSNGANTQQTNINPNNALNPNQITVGQGLTPGQANTPVTVMGANNQQGVIPASQFQSMTGNRQPTGNVAPMQGGGPTAPISNLPPQGQQGMPQGQGAPQGGNGRYPGAPQQPGSPPGFVATTPPPGSADVATGGAQRYNTIQQAAGAARTQMHSYDIALDAVDKAVVGKGSSVIDIAKVMNTFGLPVTGDKVKDTQVLQSQLASAADQAAASLGLAGSDARLQAAKAGQPNGEMNKPALIQQIRYVKGLQQGVLDKSQAVTNYLAQNNNNTSGLPQFEAQFNKSFDPDVSYIRSISDPAAKKEAIEKLPNHAQYVKSVGAMKAMGAF